MCQRDIFLMEHLFNVLGSLDPPNWMLFFSQRSGGGGSVYIQQIIWQIFQRIFGGIFQALFWKSKKIHQSLPYKNTSDIFTSIQEIWKRRRDEFHLSLSLLPRYKLRASESMSVLRHFSFREETQFSRILQILKHWVGGERLASRRTFQVSTDHFSISEFQKICKKNCFAGNELNPFFSNWTTQFGRLS